MTSGRGTGDGHAVFAGDIFEKILKVDFLLIAASERGGGGLSDDRDDGLMVEFRVVETVEQMDCAGAAGREADADGAGEFRMGAGHECG